MKIKFILLFSLLLITQVSLGIRSVGNGGGEAEMKALSQFETLPLWLKFCKENIQLCFKNHRDSNSKLNAIDSILNKQQITFLKFVNKADYSSPIIQNELNSYTLILTHESLYIDNRFSKSENEIFLVLVNQILNIENVRIQINEDDILLTPKGFFQSEQLVGVLQSTKSDYLISLQDSINLHKELSQKFNIHRYKILSLSVQELLLKDLDRNIDYLLILKKNNNELSIDLRYTNIED